MSGTTYSIHPPVTAWLGAMAHMLQASYWVNTAVRSAASHPSVGVWSYQSSATTADRFRWYLSLTSPELSSTHWTEVRMSSILAVVNLIRPEGLTLFLPPPFANAKQTGH